MEVVDKSKMSWLLKRNQEEYVLSVICGTSAIYNIDIQLTDVQISSYLELGKDFIEELSQAVRNEPSDFRAHFVKE